MHFEDICAHLSPKSSLIINPEEKKTQGQKVKENNNLSWIYRFFKHVFENWRSLSRHFRDEGLNHKLFWFQLTFKLWNKKLFQSLRRTKYCATSVWVCVCAHYLLSLSCCVCPQRYLQLESPQTPKWKRTCAFAHTHNHTETHTLDLHTTYRHRGLLGGVKQSCDAGKHLDQAD